MAPLFAHHAASSPGGGHQLKFLEVSMCLGVSVCLGVCGLEGLSVCVPVCVYPDVSLCVFVCVFPCLSPLTSQVSQSQQEGEGGCPSRTELGLTGESGRLSTLARVRGGPERPRTAAQKNEASGWAPSNWTSPQTQPSASQQRFFF